MLFDLFNTLAIFKNTSTRFWLRSLISLVLFIKMIFLFILEILDKLMLILSNSSLIFNKNIAYLLILKSVIFIKIRFAF